MHSPPQCSILRLPLRAKAIGRLAMRTWLNGWVTTRRFHEAHQMKCILGCVDQDCQQHYLCGCPVLRQCLFPGFWSPTAFDRLARVCWRCLLCVCDLHLFHELLSQSSCLDLPWQVLCTQNNHCRRALRAKRPSTSACNKPCWLDLHSPALNSHWIRTGPVLKTDIVDGRFARSARRQALALSVVA